MLACLIVTLSRYLVMVVREAKAFLVNHVFCRWELYCLDSAMLLKPWRNLVVLVCNQIAKAHVQFASMEDLIRHSGTCSI